MADISPLQLDRGFRAQWLGQLGSAIGRETAKFAFPVHIYLQTGSLALLGGVAIFQLLATIVLSLSSGTLSDLFDRRLVLVGSLAVMTGASLGLFVITLVGGAPLWLIVLLGVIVTTFFTMEQPARISAVPRLVAPQRLPSAIALTSLNFQGMSVAGPAIAALFFGVAGLAGAYALQLAGYAWATIVSSRMPALPPESREVRSPIRMLAESVAFVRQRRIILSGFAVDLTAMILALPMGSLLPVLLIEAYGVTPEVVGVLLAARGIGALGAAAFSGWTRSIRSLGRGVLVMVVIYSLATIAIGLAPHYLIAIPFLALTGAADVSSAILRNTIIQTATPDELRGRVTAIHVLSSASGPRIGDVRAALMAEALGAKGALILGGVMAVLLAGTFGRIFPELRTYRLPIPELPSSPGPSRPSVAADPDGRSDGDP
jgi:MFS family permease